MSAAYEKYRLTKIESGKLYQDFVVDCLWQTIGLAVVQYSSVAYQLAIGESRTGVEIKHDEKFAKTRNLWIEGAEKARPRAGDYFPSGIFRADNTWLYVIGDYDKIFIFGKKLLRGLWQSGRYPIVENNTSTSQGILLKEALANRYADAIVLPNASKKVVKLVDDLRKIGQELHQIALQNPAQASLFQDDREPPP